MKKFKILSAAILICFIGLGAFLVSYTFHQVKQPLNLPVTELLTIEDGSSFSHFSKLLVKKGWLESRFWLRNYVRLKPAFAQIKAGTYQIEKNTSLDNLLKQLITGKEHQFTITFIEGTTLKQWLALIRTHPRIKHTLTNTELAYNNQYKEVAEKLKLSITYPEGLFFPETYAFINQTTDVAILQRAYKKMQQELNSVWQSRMAGLPYDTPYQALIMASIIEKESGLYTEHELISSVFVNRLNLRMRLQTDPTIIYGLGERYKGNIKREHKREKTAYNTYRINGLPPTPIAMPSKAALAATLNPETSEYLYFVSNGAGKHIFSKNLADHNKAVVKYQLNRK